jgi:hypothetical protein
VSISAMKYALQALENSHAYLPVKTGVEREVDQAAHFLRQAIAEAEKQEPVAWIRNKAMWCTGELLLQSIGAEIEIPLYTAPVHASDISQERVDETAKRKHEWVGLDSEIPGLGLVTEEFYNGMIFAEDILREKNT